MRRSAALGAAFALALAMAVPGPAAAATPQLSVSVAHVRLVSRIYVDVSVTVTCDLGADVQGVESEIDVYVRQLSGNRQASASNMIELEPEQCDGAPHSGVVRLEAAPYGRLFHAGRAQVEVDAFVYGWTDEYDDVSVDDSTGWMSVRLHR
jgi:hypothetical protein